MTIYQDMFQAITIQENQNAMNIKNLQYDWHAFAKIIVQFFILLEKIYIMINVGKVEIKGSCKR